MLDRESALKTVVRDREILVNRMIKLNNKKPAESALEAHQAKIEDAQRELTACEGECLSRLLSGEGIGRWADGWGVIVVVRSVLAGGGGGPERGQAEQLP